MAERALSYRNLCFDKDMRFSHTDLGFNYRMTNLQAAVGVAQLEMIDEIVLFKERWVILPEKCQKYQASGFN